MSMNTPVPVPVVPAKVRFVLYWLSWALSTIGALISGVWQLVAAAAPDITAPLWVTLAAPVLLLVTAQLNALAGSNVTAAPSLVVRREESGRASMFTMTGVTTAVAAAFLLAAFILWFVAGIHPVAGR